MLGLNEQQVNIEIGLGEEWLNQALGGVIPSKMSGQVWVDENDNGDMDAGEITPENEMLTLLDETGAVIALFFFFFLGYLALSTISRKARRRRVWATAPSPPRAVSSS